MATNSLICITKSYKANMLSADMYEKLILYCSDKSSKKNSLQIIKRTFYLLKALHTHMCKNLGRTAAVTQQFLNIPQVRAALQQMRRVAVPKPVQSHRFFNFDFLQYLL